jgi:aspartyl-tRNA(Asn)/glutamyl-tRNA(Gln) amidotransferase subunit A
MTQDLTLLNAAALQQAYAQGLCDPVAVTQAHLARIAKRNLALHAFVHVSRDLALQQAQASAQRWASGQPFGPLDGVVMALKDNIDVVGMPCTAGTAAYAQRMPMHDAPVYQRLRDAGMVLLGKLNMHEAALGATTDNPVYGRCINPLREGFTPGGSSGGSAAAVADQLCTIAMGTDTMGSVRIPAAYCGVMGMIPSRMRLPMDGIVPLSPTLDVAGPLARSGVDLAQTMACLLGISLAPAAQESVWRGLRVGILPQTTEVEMAPAVHQAWQATQQRLQAHGAQLQTVLLPDWSPARNRLHALLMSEWEGADYWQNALGSELPGLSAGLQKMLHYGARLGPEKRQTSQAAIDGLRTQAGALFADIDVLLLPTTPHASFAHTEAAPASQADWACLANMLGAPALSFPCPTEDLPVSCQLLAAPGQDERLLSLACALDTFWG